MPRAAAPRTAAYQAVSPRAPRVRGTARPPAATEAHAGRGNQAALRMLGSARPLDAGLRHSMETRLGHDFSAVRVHTGAMEAQSAAAIGSSAYTVGEDMVFGEGRYDPASASGQELIAHELTHVVQQAGSPASGRVEIGPAADGLEREATAQAAHVRRPDPGRSRPHRRARGRVLQRSLLGGIVGGVLGAVGVAVLGALVGGPIGAVVGGLAGLAGGALAGDALTTRKRALSGPEVAYAREVFKDSIDYTPITITRDSMISTGAPKTIGNTVHLRSDWGHFRSDTLDLTDTGRETLIHEMGHVWQYQNGGLAYIPQSLLAQLRAAVGSGNRNAAYDWREAHAAKIPWERWNPEQQAAAIEDYNIKLRRSKDKTATLADIADLAILLPYMKKVWARQGAPHF